MVGGELNRTRGKRGGYQGTSGQVVSPPLVTPSLRSKRFREHFRTVFDSHSSFFAPKPHGKACFTGYSPLVFFPAQFFARALQSERLEQARGSLVSYLCQDPGA